MLPIRPEAMDAEKESPFDPSSVNQDSQHYDNVAFSPFDSSQFYYHDINGEPFAGFGRGVGLCFVSHYFPKTDQVIRITSGYFSLRGYHLCHKLIKENVHVHFLVGRGEGAEAKQSIALEIEKELGQTQTPLYEAVADVISRMRRKQFRIRGAGERYPPNNKLFHCKFVICDDSLMWSGSANFTFPGLHFTGNEEQVTRAESDAVVKLGLRYFDATMAQSHDLLEEVALCLEEWLAMATPFHAYLKALDCCFTNPQSLGEGGLVPTYFQETVIRLAANSLLQHQGCLLLVGTGLGKTVIGAETMRRIRLPASAQKVIVLAPKNLLKAWDKQLDARQIPYEFFDISLLFRASAPEKDNQVTQLETALEACGDTTVIVVDEAHKYRGLLRKEAGIDRKNAKLSADEQQQCRLRERFDAATERDARILLLTATPFGTNYQDINSLLSLLPPNAPTDSKRWKITKLKETAALFPVTVLSLYDVLHMASIRGDAEQDGRLYLRLPDGRHFYLPKRLESHRVEYSPLLSQEFADAFDAKAFRGKFIPYDRFDEEQDKTVTGIANTTENNAVIAWLSSPAELKRIVKNYCTPPKSPQQPSSASPPPSASRRRRSEELLELEEQQRLLQPLQNALHVFATQSDEKLRELTRLIGQHTETKCKVIVFVRRYATARFLEEQINRLLPQISVGCTVREDKDEAELKSPRDRERIIREFAPNANEGRRKPTRNHDILICTDADGIGLNMQDANVVINYDLPPSVDLLWQRVGRVIRMTDDPERTVIVYTFLPRCAVGSPALEKALSRLRNTMQERHEKSATVVGGSILPQDDQPLIVPMANKEEVAQLMQHFPLPENSLVGNVAATDLHFALYDRHKAEAARLPLTLLSIKEYRGTQPQILVYFQWQGAFRCLLYDLDLKQIADEDSAERSRRFLDLLQCDETEPKGYVSAKAVENAAIEATQAWLSTHQKQKSEAISDENDDVALLRVCAIYLKPLGKSGTKQPHLADILTEIPPPEK